MRIKHYLILCLLGSMIACESAPKEVPKERTSTEEMVLMLGEHARQMNHRSYPYASSLRAYHTEREEQTLEGRELLGKRFERASDLLDAGRYEEAAVLFENLWEVVYSTDIEVENNLVILRMLGLSLLKAGQQINDEGVDSYYTPIDGRSRHAKADRTKQAASVFKQVLQYTPEDYNIRYLLNLANMHAGQYPDSVPSKFLLAESTFTAGETMDPFIEVGKRTKVDVKSRSGSVIMDDFTNDGLLDLLVSSMGVNDQLQFFKNTGGGTFRNQTKVAMLEGLTGGVNMVQADYDNDGDLDVYICRGGWLGTQGKVPNSLLRNDGRGIFTDVTKEAGMMSLKPSQAAAWGDMNNDGWVDLYVGAEAIKEGHATLKGDANPDETTFASELWLNNQNGTFREVAKQVGVDVVDYVKAVSWGDANNDGLIDLFVSSMYGQNYFFRNMGPDNDYAMKNQAGILGMTNHYHSYANWFWDHNNDGLLDIFVASYPISNYSEPADDFAKAYHKVETDSEHPHVYTNKGDGSFEESSVAMGLDKPMFIMGANYGDLNNDGYMDLYFGTGDADHRSMVPNQTYLSHEGSAFKKLAASAGLDHIMKGSAAAIGDIDNDGDQDMYVVMGGALEGDVYNNVLYLNPGNENHWISVKLEGGRKSNANGIGSKIQVNVSTPDGDKDYRTLVFSGGSNGSSSLTQHIGLGNASSINRLTVVWHSGETHGFDNIKMDTHYVLDEKSRQLKVVKRRPINFVDQ